MGWAGLTKVVKVWWWAGRSYPRSATAVGARLGVGGCGCGGAGRGGRGEGRLEGRRWFGSR